MILMLSPATIWLDESLGFLMRRILTAISNQIDNELGSSGLTNAQWAPLLMLYAGRGTTVAELARECHIDPGAMTRMLDRLEAKGLVRRARSRKDRRVVNLELTIEGKAVAQEIPVVLRNVQSAYMHGFTADESALLKSMLERIFDNLRAGRR
jgi:DNA-binding MarR family transcriptional regulator